MTDVRVREIDPGDQTRLQAWWAIGRAASERPLDLWLPWETARLTHSRPDPDRDTVLLGAFEGQAMVGAGWIGMPLADNEHLFVLDVHVAPDERRRGIGAVLLAEGEARARTARRTTILSEVFVPLDGETEGSRWAAAHGYPVAGIEDVKAADLVATEGTWPALADLAAERLGAYTLVSWLDPTPEEHVEDLCALWSRFLGEIPLGDMDLRPQAWTAEKLRRAEARRAETGRAHLLVAAVAPDGALVGYSDLTVAAGRPHLASIDSTLVLPEHRGRRLGLAMKVRLHQEARRRFPECTVIVTGNADVNDHMNTVNAQLGYRIVDRCLNVQKVLA